MFESLREYSTIWSTSHEEETFPPGPCCKGNYKYTALGKKMVGSCRDMPSTRRLFCATGTFYYSSNTHGRHLHVAVTYLMVEGCS